MSHDEFAFLNQQLAAMLRDGIPLEGALRQLCAQMRRGPLRTELEALGADLARGVPLKEAMAARHLPELYRRMIQVGVHSHDLPAVLTLLADYYQRLHFTWTRLKGLMVYPVLVLAMALVMCYFMTGFFAPKLMYAWEDVAGASRPRLAMAGLWFPPVLVTALFGAVLATLCVPALRRLARWKLPAFRESSLAQVALAMALMLKSGVPLGDALALAADLEQGSPAGRELTRWRERLASGSGRFPAIAAGSITFPPLFVWLVSQGGEDLAAGFQRAADLYQARAAYRTELQLYAALPCSILVLGAMIVAQAYPLLAELVRFMNSIGEV